MEATDQLIRINGSIAEQQRQLLSISAQQTDEELQLKNAQIKQLQVNQEILCQNLQSLQNYLRQSRVGEGEPVPLQ